MDELRSVADLKAQFSPFANVKVPWEIAQGMLHSPLLLSAKQGLVNVAMTLQQVVESLRGEDGWCYTAEGELIGVFQWQTDECSSWFFFARTPAWFESENWEEAASFLVFGSYHPKNRPGELRRILRVFPLSILKLSFLDQKCERPEGTS